MERQQGSVNEATAKVELKLTICNLGYDVNGRFGRNEDLRSIDGRAGPCV